MKRRRVKNFSQIGLVVLAGLALGLGAYTYLNSRELKSAENTRPLLLLPTNESLEENSPAPLLSLSDDKLEQSDVFTVVVTNVPKDASVSATWSDRRYDLFPIGNKFIAILGVDAKKAPGKYSLQVAAGTTALAADIAVARRAFPITELALTPELKEAGYTASNISSGVTDENERLNSVLIYTPSPYFKSQFINPLENIKIGGGYGNIRKSAVVELQHLGVDLDAPTGTPVYAVNDGAVRLADTFTNYGNTIVIDHGVGIFSFYLHLNEFNVVVGEKVARGEIIGRVGNTGYSLEPHLHFSVRIRNASVDPLRFIEKANTAF